MIGHEGFLDRAPLGRNEGDPPSGVCPATTGTHANVTAQYSKQKPRAQSRAD